jgi:NADH dehydrogenase (ubiquinone) 1 alpha subcomplex subunit 6
MALSKGAAALDVRKVLSQRVVNLYRRMCRDTPAVIKIYNLEHTPFNVRHMLLLQFRKNSEVTDPRIIELLLQRAEMELEETREQWKQR